jgi:molybdate/tungstate transport system permease protein
VAGIVLTFARATGEFGATMMVAYNPRTMPTQLWVAFISGGIDAIVPLALALLAITLAVLALVRRVARVPTVVDT